MPDWFLVTGTIIAAAAAIIASRLARDLDTPESETPVTARSQQDEPAEDE